MVLVVPAVLPSSRKDLEEKLALLVKIPLVSRIQIDVVDGKFAMPASWPFSGDNKGRSLELETMVQKGEMLPALDRLEYEIDLMCLDAERVAADWLALGASRLTFHAETVTDLPRLFAFINNRYGGDVVSFGLALNIASDLALIEQCLGEVSYVQFMGIARIGSQGQPFDRRVLEKIRIFRSRHPEVSVQVDGGVSFESAKELVALGVSNLVIGSSILRASDPSVTFAEFEGLRSPYGV